MKNLFLILLSITLLTACEDVIDVNIKSFEQALIVEGGILHRIDQSSFQQTIRLTESTDFLDQTKNPAVTDAIVEVSDGENVYSFTHQSNGNYLAEVPSQIGKTYRLRIVYKGEEIIAEETLVDVNPIDTIYTEFEEATTFSDAGYFVKIDTRDQAGIPNFYYWQLFVNDTFRIVPDPGNQANLIVNDDFFDGEIIRGYKPNEEIVLTPGDKVTVKQLGITERYYDYLFEVFGQTGSTPFLGNPPPARIRSNLFYPSHSDQYVLGYFSVASMAEASTIVLE